MKLHADLSQRVVVFSEALLWLDSPMAGVQRRLLERDGEEVARATSIVHYAPGSHFSAHTHGGGEEFLVLEGIFSDEHGDYPAGTYIRNPVGSRHTPSSQGGCTILVKLWQMQPQDQQRVAIDTTQANWLPGTIAGSQVLPLHTYGTEQVLLARWESGTRFRRLRYFGGEEIFVLEGEFEDELGVYPQGTWLRNPSNCEHRCFSRTGCLIYVKTGHLQPLET